MDRNTLLAVALSMLVFSGWLSYEAANQPPRATLSDSVETEETLANSVERESPVLQSAEGFRSGGEQIPRADSATAAARLSEAAAVVDEWRESFDGEVYRVGMDNRGAGITSWTLLDPLFTVESGSDTPPIELVTRTADSPVVFATPLEDLGIGNLVEAAFQVLEAGPERVVFGLDRDGVEVRKRFDFVPGSYEFAFTLEITNRSNRSLRSNFEVLWPAAPAEGNDFKEQSLVVLANDDVERTSVASVGSPGFFDGLFGGGRSREGGPVEYAGPIEWAGVDTQYFVSAFLPQDRNAAVVFLPLLPGKAVASVLRFGETEIPPGGSARREIRAYIGPKFLEKLEATESQLERSINRGYSWLEPLTIFFHWLLVWLYGVVPNYGVAIIVLTIMVRIVTLPIMQKQMRSMEKMRTLQPQLKEIQERYKEDRQRQSEEMMKLYKTEGANPLSGCLPMILQFPVFIGLFYTLQSTIELRHAPFVLWITDLSAPEALFTVPGVDLPIRLLPLVMGASMFLQQKMTPATGMDPAQAKMMTTIMPLMMTVLFYQFPSGLVLYWMVSNFLGIGHQLWVRRNMEASEEVRAKA